MSVKPVPEGYHTVTPYFTVADAGEVIAFAQKVFDAELKFQMMRPDGKVGHSEIRIGDSKIMLGSATEEWGAAPGMVYIYLEGVDELYRRAIEAGGVSLREPRTEFYGDRAAGVRDPQGNQWWIATHVEDVSEEELQRRAKAAGRG